MQGSDVEEMVLCAEFGDWSLFFRNQRIQKDFKQTC